MNTAMPTTQRENDGLRDDELFCSKTDIRGSITYANIALCRISGFDESELLGSPHGILRHPDMPRMTDAWMQDTLSRGLIWQAVVKDRCKNGDHYWVDVNISGQYDSDGGVIGYLSTRRKPTQGMIEEAEARYASLLQAEGPWEQRSQLSDGEVDELYRKSFLYSIH